MQEAKFIMTIHLDEEIKEDESKELMKEQAVMPVLALRGLIVFPDMSVHFDVGRKKSILAVNQAMEMDQTVFLVCQKDFDTSEPKQEHLYKTGVVAKIKQVYRNPEDGLRLFVEGICRAQLLNMLQDTPFMLGSLAMPNEVDSTDSHRSQALMRHMKTVFENYIHNYKNIPTDILMGVTKQKESGALADYIAGNIALGPEIKQQILEIFNADQRLEFLIEVLQEETKILEIENLIASKAKDQMDQHQREYFLREQIRAIYHELGEDESPEEEHYILKGRIFALDLPEKQEEKLLKECDRLSKMPPGSHEGSVLRNYLETCLDLPWNQSGKSTINLNKVERVLNKEHYGLTKVKERILESLAVRKLNAKMNGQIICLVGPPGVGKSSIAKSIAKAIGLDFERISLGGVRDESEIMGHRRTYVGSMPGRIISAVKQAGINNPVILLDEIDKLCKDFRGDPASALLEVLDIEQNSTFTDHYIDIPFDLSGVMFITTANDAAAIPAPLFDRMDVITLSSYTHEEKFQIASKHLIPRQLQKHGLTTKQLKITPAAIHIIIEHYTKEAGVRGLERKIADVCRKCAKNIVENPNQKITINEKQLTQYLGSKKYKKDQNTGVDEVGLVNGLAWTSVGGELLPIEAVVMDGTGKIELTGNLGDVMKESAKTAISCVRSRVDKLGIMREFYKRKDIHIHAPEGAIPKDGPSAGIAMATVMTSVLTSIPICHDVAMTGEITLQGRVLPIGGLKEKTMAAYRAGVKRVIIPADNVADLEDVEQVVKDSIEFFPVRKIDEVLELALTRKPVPRESLFDHDMEYAYVEQDANQLTLPSI